MVHVTGPVPVQPGGSVATIVPAGIDLGEHDTGRVGRAPLTTARV